MSSWPDAVVEACADEEEGRSTQPVSTTARRRAKT
jgi:hypothetical protein